MQVANLFLLVGHEVPFWQPQRAKVMFEHFLTNSPLPKNPQLNLIADPIVKHFMKQKDD